MFKIRQVFAKILEIYFYKGWLKYSEKYFSMKWPKGKFITKHYRDAFTKIDINLFFYKELPTFIFFKEWSTYVLYNEWGR